MYSSGLPIMFPITAVNFILIYWIDKTLLLRFYRTPKNYDEKCIEFSIKEMKFGFIFHFIIGALVYSNARILSSSGSNNFFKDSASKDVQSFFHLSRYNSTHVLLFFLGTIMILILLFFESTIFSWMVRNIKILANLQQKFEEMDAISDDYYDQINFKFMVTELERTK